MSFFSNERWITVNCSIQISREDMFNLPRNVDMSWQDVGKLNPVFQEGVGDPVDKAVTPLASEFLGSVKRFFLTLEQLALDNPVVPARTINLAPEPELRSARHLGQLLHALGQLQSFFPSEVDPCPFKHRGFLGQIRHGNLSFALKVPVLNINISYLFQENSGLLEPDFELWIRFLSSDLVHLRVELGVFQLQVGLLHKGRDFFQFVEGV